MGFEGEEVAVRIDGPNESDERKQQNTGCPEYEESDHDTENVFDGRFHKGNAVATAAAAKCQDLLDFAQDNGLILAFAVVAIIILLEWKSVLWRRWRKYTVGAAVFLINTAVILGMASLLIIAAITAPMLVHR